MSERIVTDIEYEGRKWVADPPLVLRLLGEDDVDGFELFGHSIWLEAGQTFEEAVGEEVAFLWDSYACAADDQKMTPGAQKLRDDLRRMLRVSTG